MSKKLIFTNLKNGFEHIELSAKLLDYFLRRNKSNIHQNPCTSICYVLALKQIISILELFAEPENMPMWFIK